jgi:hypothetical protein
MMFNSQCQLLATRHDHFTDHADRFPSCWRSTVHQLSICPALRRRTLRAAHQMTNTNSTGTAKKKHRRDRRNPI